MSDLNKWIGSGRVTRDTELNFSPNGTAVAEIGMCSNRTWTKDGERVEDPTFIDVTLWGKQAEVLAQYLKKGAFIMVEGRLQLDSWEAEDGSRRNKMKVVASQINLGPKGSNSGGGKSKSAEVDNSDEGVPF